MVNPHFWVTVYYEVQKILSHGVHENEDEEYVLKIREETVKNRKNAFVTLHFSITAAHP